MQNDYPFIKLKDSKKGIKWKLIDAGMLDIQNEEDCAFVARVISGLEYEIKGVRQNMLDRINHMKEKR